MKAHFKTQYGFTLLEVMVSLAVFAVAAASLSMAGGNSVKKVDYLKTKTVASLVAENHIAAIRMDQLWPSTGASQYTINMAGRVWSLERLVSETSSQRLRRLDIDVKDMEADQVVAQLTAFINKPSSVDNES